MVLLVAAPPLHLLLLSLYSTLLQSLHLLDLRFLLQGLQLLLAMSQLMFEECSEIQFTHHDLQILIAASAHALLQFADQLIREMNLSLGYLGKMQTTTFQLGTM